MINADDAMLSGMDEVLTSLPVASIVARQGRARLVVGPSGAFVLLPARGDRPSATIAAEMLVELVHTTRNALCDLFTWVPFLDALLVTDGHPPHDFDVSAASLDLVHDVLTEGPTVITLGTLNAIREALRSNRVDGWQIGSATSNGNINLRDPVRPTPTG